MRRPRLLVLTHFAFWRLGDGERVRLLAMIRVLERHAHVHVLLLRRAAPTDAEELRALGLTSTVAGLDGEPTPAEQLAAVAREAADGAFDACLFERITTHFLRDAVPASVRTVIDTLDLMSVYAASCVEAGLPVPLAITLEQELELLATYDRVLLIQPEELQLVEPHLGERAMLAGHAVEAEAAPTTPDRRRLGVVGSQFIANQRGLDWFADEVWPHLADADAAMHVFGRLSSTWRTTATVPFHRHGFVPDIATVWRSFDVAVNPVRYGAGLKIKNVEALAHGLPLVTTTEGARGLRDGVDVAFRVADDAVTFAAHCRVLLDDPDGRRSLARAAHDFARQRFAPEVCFGPLVRWLAT